MCVFRFTNFYKHLNSAMMIKTSRISEIFRNQRRKNLIIAFIIKKDRKTRNRIFDFSSTHELRLFNYYHSNSASRQLRTHVPEFLFITPRRRVSFSFPRLLMAPGLSRFCRCSLRVSYILVIFVPRILAKKNWRSENVSFLRLSLRLVVVVIWICPGVKYRSLSDGRFFLKPDEALEVGNTKKREQWQWSCEKSCCERISIQPPSSRNPRRRQRNRRDFPYDFEAFDL